MLVSLLLTKHLILTHSFRPSLPSQGVVHRWLSPSPCLPTLLPACFPFPWWGLHQLLPCWQNQPCRWWSCHSSLPAWLSYASLHYFPKAQLWSPLCWKYQCLPLPPAHPHLSPLFSCCPRWVLLVRNCLFILPVPQKEWLTRVEMLRDLPVSPPHPQFACYKRPSVGVYQGIMSVLPLSSSSPSVHVLENLIHLWFQGNIKVNKTDLRVLRHLPPFGETVK